MTRISHKRVIAEQSINKLIMVLKNISITEKY